MTEDNMPQLALNSIRTLSIDEVQPSRRHHHSQQKNRSNQGTNRKLRHDRMKSERNASFPFHSNLATSRGTSFHRE
jgi:hypothetical protein